MEHDIIKIRNEAQALINELIEEANFDRFLQQKNTWSEWYYGEDNRGDIPSHIGISYGCTRMVLWDEDSCDYVFKINLHSGKDDIDYGASEEFIYDRACEEGVGDCFAWTAKVLDIEGFPVYAMAFCDVDGAALSETLYEKQFRAYCDDEGYNPDDLTDEQRDEINDWLSDYSGPDGMLDYIYEIYDRDEYERLTSFLDKYNIGDVHCGNWGYYNGKLILTDYAGYCIDLVAYAKNNVPACRA